MTRANTHGASAGLYVVSDPSATASRSSTTGSSRWAIPVGPETAAIKRPCSEKVRRALMIVCIISNHGSITKLTKNAIAVTTSVTTSR